MLKLYFKTAYRNLWRSKGFSAINVFGLAIGIATCLLIILFVGQELSYDRFHEKADRIVRIVFRGQVQGEEMKEAHVMPPVAQALVAEYPEVQEVTRLRWMGTPKISVNDKTFRNNTFVYADSNFFQVFTLPLVKGDPATALKEPNSLVISESTARMYFGRENPLGKVLQLKDWEESYTIKGIMADIPANSHFQTDLLASMITFPEARNPSWMVSEFYTYLVLPEGYDYKVLEAKLPQLAEKYMGPQLQESMGISFAQFHEAGNSIGLFLEPLTSIHLHSETRSVLEAGGDIRYVYIFSAIGLFMLLIACINFMNLSTAAAATRAKEVGVRKVLGSGTKQLVGQFLTESILLSLLALLLALVVVKGALPFFNELSGKSLSMPYLSNPWLLPGLLLFGILVGVLAGSYPAFFLSAFKPVSVLKGVTPGASGRSSLRLRSGLVVFQFSISIMLLIGTAVVYQQLEYIQDKKLGYEKEQVLVLPEASLLGKQAAVFKQQLLQDPRVLQVSTSGYLPAGPTNNNNYLVHPPTDPSRRVLSLRYEVDAQYLSTLGLKLKAGRNFSEDSGADSTAIILNETAVAALGWGGEALGKTLSHANNEGKKTTYHVIGVVGDFHFKPLHERISPLVMTLGSNNGAIIAKIGTAEVGKLLTSIKEKWDALAADEPFEYSFLDERFAQTYESEQKAGNILGIFAGLTIFVACLGLFGLATYTAQQRTKEIGIRKVLGAEVPGLIALLSKDFLKLVLLAALIASPVAWYAMNKWLEEFAYRIEVSLWIFITAGVIALIIAFFTISFQAMTAATRNPIKSLRTE